MIHSLLYVGLLCMGVGAKASTPINLIDEPQIHNKTEIKYEKNNANNTTDYNFSFGNAIVNHYDNTDLSPRTPQNATGTTNAQLKTGKTKYANVQNDFISVNTISYASNYRTKNNSTYTTEYAVNTNAYRELRMATCGLLSIQFTPYLANLDNQIKIRISTQLAIPGQANRQFVLRNEYFITQDQEKGQAGWDISNWNTQYEIYNTFDNVAGDRYTGSYSYTDSAITTNSTTPQTITSAWIDINIPAININGTRASTYVYVRSTCYLAHADNMPDHLGCSNINANEPIAPGMNHTIRGTGIQANIDYEVVDVPGLLWQILSMPFSFISTAFNLTLFPGTPYQVNISNLILMIFGILVFLLIFKLLLKK